MGFGALVFGVWVLSCRLFHPLLVLADTLVVQTGCSGSPELWAQDPIIVRAGRTGNRSSSGRTAFCLCLCMSAGPSVPGWDAVHPQMTRAAQLVQDSAGTSCPVDSGLGPECQKHSTKRVGTAKPKTPMPASQFVPKQNFSNSFSSIRNRRSSTDSSYSNRSSGSIVVVLVGVLVVAVGSWWR